jgi:DNA-binding NtrC family response regulator
MEKSKIGKVLIVDDNIQILNSLDILLKPEFDEITLSRDPLQIPSLMNSKSFDIILLDMNFTSGDNSGKEGIRWLTEILKIDPSMIVIMITAYGDINLAVEAIKKGATDFIAKPWDADKLIITLVNALKIRKSKDEINKLKTRQKQLIEDNERQHILFRGISPVMEKIYRTIDKVAATDANILILGENGTGKEIVAREIHKKSRRSSEIFLAVDMGSISESLFESEMFGHIKGSFTDAREDRAGRFETASGGTLFLDEIANLSMSSQSKLLGVLQNFEVTRLGATKSFPVDVRLIAATNSNPEELVRQNLFREDLLFRINTIQIEIPPLRERKEDIPGFADFYLRIFGARYKKPLLKLTGAAYDVLSEYHWNGNIRELKHTMEKAVILSEGNVIRPDDLNLKPQKHFLAEENEDLKLSDIERNAIIKILQKCHGNVSQAAKILDISRTTLYAKMKDYKI